MGSWVELEFRCCAHDIVERSFSVHSICVSYSIETAKPAACISSIRNHHLLPCHRMNT